MEAGFSFTFSHFQSCTHTQTDLWVAMAANVHLCEGADVTDAHHLHGEVAEEVDDLEGLVP